MRLIKIMAMLLLIIYYPVKADEEFLFLSGKVKEIKENIIVVDVISGSCKGLRKFKASPEEIKKIKENKRKRKLIFFSIDSSECAKEKIYQIKEVN